MMYFSDLSKVTPEALQDLVTNRIQEGLTLEFKRELNLGKDRDKKEVPCDVTAFANSVGGHILYGVDEGDGPDGTKVAVAIAPLTAPDLDSVLSNILNSTVHPRVFPQMRAVTVLGGYVLAVEIPPSQGDLHMVTGYGESRYYRRSAKGRTLMTEPEIREQYARIATERSRLEGRLADLLRPEMELRSSADESIVIIPWFGRDNLVDPRSIGSIKTLVFSAIDGSTFDSTLSGLIVTGDGIKTRMDKSDQAIDEFIAIRRRGVVHFSDFNGLAPISEYNGVCILTADALFRLSVALMTAREVYRISGYMDRVRVHYVLRPKTVLYVDRNYIHPGQGTPRGERDLGPFDFTWNDLTTRMNHVIKDIMDRVFQLRGAALCPYFDDNATLTDKARKDFHPIIKRAYDAAILPKV